MKLVPITHAQASFLEIEIVGRYTDDENFAYAAVAAIVGDHLHRSFGGGMAVPSTVLIDMLLDVINGIDDEIEAASKKDKSALGRIGGVETISEARRLHRTGSMLIEKARAA